ncbi:MAG: leucine-rich repeat domain-containing protein [Prevotella sp.]|nr:leucine-rich repeat domain-containing protein [Prevotella sp.]
MKHIFTTRAFILSLLLSLPCVRTLAYDFYAKNDDGVNIYYYITSSTDRTVAVSGGTYSGDVVIPSTVEYESISYSVTGIGIYAFDDCSSLTSIEIPSSVTSIGYYAFVGCI